MLSTFWDFLWRYDSDIDLYLKRMENFQNDMAQKMELSKTKRYFNSSGLDNARKLELELIYCLAGETSFTSVYRVSTK